MDAQLKSTEEPPWSSVAGDTIEPKEGDKKIIKKNKWL